MVLDSAWLRMEDVVLSPAVIALVVLEEREEAEEGEGGEYKGKLRSFCHRSCEKNAVKDLLQTAAMTALRMFGSDPTKGFVAKVGNNASVGREVNSYGEERSGGGGRSDSSVEEDDEEDEKGNEDADGAVGGAGADAKRAEGAVQGGDLEAADSACTKEAGAEENEGVESYARNCACALDTDNVAVVCAVEAFVEAAEDSAAVVANLCEGSAVLVGVAVARQWFGDFVNMWLGEKHVAQKKSEAEILKMIFVVELFLNDFADVLLLKKFVREECEGDKLWFS
ncbi:uncharacterized protein MONOS_11060 [Monocercomonoides exilis]|uniref:uncharacterized protein n=1 Tax=Monocercomonoides exilis TaxID=2049356 RepID=UPI00355A78E3|nr:hypothetical protein MONOS_11060 [Monocercomonoides exilis]|eukprot:MONOS_11060.1-p1 / transcript=MONOS_11060.1 / gene=MONOS_11060 / organism=Monocercomonoides_exilis_PA203 / gene_product=unspecified product / transcript_product=unspecified product / location=Mono_scaffold00533:39214-40555(+) / protein_length=282 / sequence_SO=supercontig / SO=protein_coding / is_pseudo=false